MPLYYGLKTVWTRGGNQDKVKDTESEDSKIHCMNDHGPSLSSNSTSQRTSDHGEAFGREARIQVPSIAGRWQQQQLRRLNIHEYQGAELMGKHGINVPKGVAVSSLEEIKKTIQDVFPGEKELVVKSQILAGGRGLGTFKNGFQGGVHIVKSDEVEDIAGKMLGQILVTKQTGPQGKVVSKN
ncbi:hypothetical protein QJS10_CPA09g02014 [Acorus calamus]|uniref:ATP-grasp fold succinyl-CoA synthetase-type domain-containing protein n=1 Tax=Acorus calamus TaxID=4465 RepID=A0AAV9E6N4_ACOCL|nr:hypothetical protein QJS10_CPA09g02014 [Acorus calamus]